MAFIDIFNNDHLKLAGQAQDCRHRQHHKRQPARRAVFAQKQQLRCIGIGRGLRKQITDPAIHHKADKNADRQKREHLDQAFKGDGGNHAFVMFICINKTRAKQNAK